jgi:hypothetical protein
MPQQKEKKPTQLAVSSIQELTFVLNEQAAKGKAADIRLTIDLDTSYDLEKKETSLVIGARFWQDAGTPILNARVRNSFVVSNLADFIGPDTNAPELPLNLMAVLFGIAFSQTRAIIARNTSSTAFANLYLPVINPTEFLKKLQDRESA